jgi:hypothetical protein
VSLAHPVEHALVVFQRPRPDATGEDDDVGRGDLFEGGIDREPDHAVLAAHLAALVTDEDDVEVWDALQDLVGADRIERGVLREQRNGDLQAVGIGHADVLSLVTARKRRR